KGAGQEAVTYKGVSSQDKAPGVVQAVLKKNNRDPADAPHYQLVQLLPGQRELAIPPSANVFYAMDGSSLDFVLRRRRPSTPASHDAHHDAGGSSFPRIKATGRKLARALF
uniref:Ral guanine nucleotide dissociation stimulator like 2 n=1 Tax=Ornithorhynchus anatinus TaxID=9258 RepID=A0A6I8N5R3_ORNAN